MPDRITGLAASAFGIGGSSYIGDLVNMDITVQNKTAEGKAITDIDDWPVLTGRAWTATAEMEIPVSGVNMMGTALSATPNGTIAFNGGASGSYAGTAVITSASHKASREAIQTFNVTLTGRGPLSKS